jgi:hypothetical protein
MIRWERTVLQLFRGATFAFVCLFPVLCACADSPEARSTNSPSVSAESEPVRASSTPTIVIGFLGGFVRHDDAVHSTVQVAQILRKDYPSAVHILSVQVDSVAKSGQNDSLIPDNVRYAANFYQEKGFIRGQQKILAADASRTQILGNFHMDYTANLISCPQYPWYTRVFVRCHIEIECDQHVWQRVENLIREQLPTSVAASMNSR